MTQPELCLLPHEDGRLLNSTPGEFATPPRPTDRFGIDQKDVQDIAQPADEKLPCDLELWAQYEEEKARSQDPASAIALVSSAYDCEPNHVRAAIMRCMERDSSSTDQVDLSAPPPLPLWSGPPPRLDPFGRTLSSPAKEPSSLGMSAPCLVKPRVAAPQNPLLASSSSAPRFTVSRGRIMY